ncbi:MAG: diaminopimelate decarboxylase [Proteobacteria bacterium]|nr:diaminopimelate decarboxylase [Pseudomonadota bacterium]
MDHFNFKDGELFAEGCSVRSLAATHGTPLFVYSRTTLEQHWFAFDNAFGDYPHQIHYAVKANGNLAVLGVLAKLGSGFDIVSGGELKRVMAAGGSAGKVIFSGVGKLEWEIELALDVGIECFNVESMAELERIARIAKARGKVAPISMRINPDVDAKTHPYISTGLKDNKFGVSLERALSCYEFAHQHPNLSVLGVACHIGSQLTELSPLEDAMDRLLEFVKKLRTTGIEIKVVDFGGGLGVRYQDEMPPLPDQYWQALLTRMQAHDLTLPVAIEPGRALLGNAGIMVTRVEYIKAGEVGKFCVVDAAMNDFIRPALYGAYQEIINVDQEPDSKAAVYDVVGPICESADFLGKDRTLAVKPGDLLAIRTAGAYCFALSSNYNARARAAEIMVDGEAAHVVRKRESLEDLYALESLIE